MILWIAFRFGVKLCFLEIAQKFMLNILME